MTTQIVCTHNSFARSLTHTSVADRQARVRQTEFAGRLWTGPRNFPAALSHVLFAATP